MRGGVMWKQLQSFRQLGDGAVVVATEKKNGAVVQVGSWKERVQFQGAIVLRDGLAEASEIGEAKTVMRRDVAEVGIQLHAAAKRTLGRRPIALVVNFHGRERVVGFGQRVVEI